MCGIFGLITGPESKFKQKKFKSIIKGLFLLSETRGKDASGLMLLTDSNIVVLKHSLSAQKMVKTREFANEVNRFSSHKRESGETLGFMGHARMVTNGSEETHENNQPVLSHGMCMLHNGIIVNDVELWGRFPDLTREYEVDTEVALNLIFHYKKENIDLFTAFNKAFSHLQGANSIALVSADEDALVLATTNGSLYFSVSLNGNELIFASEEYILKEISKQTSIVSLFAGTEIIHVNPGTGYYFNFNNLIPAKALLGKNSNVELQVLGAKTPRVIRDIRSSNEIKSPVLPRFNNKDLLENSKFIETVNYSVSKLERCTKCVLPETFPYINFDDDGVCNYCREYQPLVFKGEDELEKILQPFRRNDGRPDCLVPVSGGRDSCYSLHYIKKVLKMNPVAYTYDWGMVTDLARRNISRMCGILGIEHILLSADIKTKRKYVRQNVSAWLKRPALGMVPLFMAGDKQYFFYAQKLRENMGIDLIVYGMNRLERTDFKVAFCGIDERKNKQSIHYAMNNSNQLRMIAYYLKEYFLNPSYINSSLLDTGFAFFSYYKLPKSYETLYDYISWDENIVNNVLINDYGWEIATDTESTWRIGDGTASFYNYIYYVMAGFSENDTFQSNRIREGMITRDDAIRLSHRDNQPRYSAIQWYCDSIRVDMHEALRRINTATKLYPLSR